MVARFNGDPPVDIPLTRPMSRGDAAKFKLAIGLRIFVKSRSLLHLLAVQCVLSTLNTERDWHLFAMPRRGWQQVARLQFSWLRNEAIISKV